MSKKNYHRIFDEKTEKWFADKPEWYSTTVRLCKDCGLFYKPSFGHKCKKRKKGKNGTNS